MPTKKLFLLILVLPFLSCSTAKPKPSLLNANRSASCQDEIEEKIAKLVNAENLHISKDVFSKTSLLYLTNRKDGIFNKSPIVNDLNGRKKLMLYRENKLLYIALYNRKDKLLKAEKLESCN